jgi:hypothetical protein
MTGPSTADPTGETVTLQIRPIYPSFPREKADMQKIGVFWSEICKKFGILPANGPAKRQQWSHDGRRDKGK